jgi:hypothetical protein
MCLRRMTTAPRPKTKRERADENWKVLDIIITESEQFEKGTDERLVALEKLHQALRQISKRPRTEKILVPNAARCVCVCVYVYVSVIVP